MDEFIGNFSAPLREPYKPKKDEPDLDALKSELTDMIEEAKSEILAEIENIVNNLVKNYNLGQTYTTGAGIAISGNVISSTLDTC